VQPITGAVPVFERRSGRHVGFAKSNVGTHFLMLGGNRSDAVITARIAKLRLLGARWPAPYPPPLQPLPTMKPGAIL